MSCLRIHGIQIDDVQKLNNVLVRLHAAFIVRYYVLISRSVMTTEHFKHYQTFQAEHFHDNESSTTLCLVMMHALGYKFPQQIASHS